MKKSKFKDSQIIGYLERSQAGEPANLPGQPPNPVVRRGMEPQDIHALVRNRWVSTRSCSQKSSVQMTGATWSECCLCRLCFR
jgi:hypothetical protein